MINYNRRNTERIEVSSIQNFYKQCDIAASSGKGDLDITILDISQQGMKFRVNCTEDTKKINQDDRLLIRGCIFNDSIGFLSNQQAVTVWKDDNLCGIKFTPELEFTGEAIREMMS